MFSMPGLWRCTWGLGSAAVGGHCVCMCGVAILRHANWWLETVCKLTHEVSWKFWGLRGPGRLRSLNVSFPCACAGCNVGGLG